jgi:tetratricopeptide (TPR) repeat protein
MAAFLLLLGETVMAATPVPMRCAEHDTHFRLVFDLPRQATLQAFRVPGGVEVEWPKAWTLEPGPECDTSDRLRKWRRLNERLMVELAGQQAVHAFPLDGPPRWVLDVGEVEANLSRRAPRPPLIREPAPLPVPLPPAPTEAFAQARQQALAGQWQKATRLLEAQVSEEGAPPDQQLELARFYRREGRQLEAARLYWQAGRQHLTHPASGYALREASRLFGELGFYYEAAKPLETYLQSFPSDPRAPQIQLQLGRLYAVAGEAGGAREELIPLTYEGVGRTPLQARYWLAYLLSQQAEPGPANEQFKSLEERDPEYLANQPQLLFGAARAALAAGEPERAKRLAGQLRTRNPGHDRAREALVLRGMANLALEEWSQARSAFVDLLRTGSQVDLEARARAGLARADYALGRVGADRAVRRLVRIAEGLPGSEAAIDARYLAAKILADSGAGGRALKELGYVIERGGPTARRQAREMTRKLLPAEMEAALQQDEAFRVFRLYNRYAGPQPAPAIHEKTFRALMDLEALRAARRLIAEERRVRGGNVRIRRWEWRVARAYRQARRPEGVAWIDGVLSQEGVHPWAEKLRLERIRLLSALDRHEAVLKALERDPGLPRKETAPLRSRAQKAQGDLEKALATLEDVVTQAEVGPLSGALLAEAGDLAARTGRVYRARAYWRRALEAGVEPWQRIQLQALLGVDAVQREDFSGAQAYFAGLPAEGAFAETAGLYASLIPLLREHLRGEMP